MATQSKRYKLLVDGDSSYILLKAFKTVVVKNSQGEDAGAVRRVFGQPEVVKRNNNHTLEVVN